MAWATNPIMNEITLQLHRRAAGLNVSNLVYSTERNQLIDKLFCMLRADFASEHQSPYCYEVPSSWWQAFKLECFPKWLLSRFPAHTTKHKVDVKTLYPFLKTQLPPEYQGHTVYVLCNDAVVGGFLSDTDGLTPTMYREQAKLLLFSERFKGSHICPCCSRAMFY